MRRWMLAALFFAGCATMPTDPLARAERARLNGDLMQALCTLDAVPITHPRYPEARARALGVEQQMRKSQELLLQGMYLRTEWRDQEAIATFTRARAIWQQLPGVDSLIQATRSRLVVFGPSAIPDASKAARLPPETPPLAAPAAAPEPPPAGALPPLPAVVEPVAPSAGPMQPAAAPPEPRPAPAPHQEIPPPVPAEAVAVATVPLVEPEPSPAPLVESRSAAVPEPSDEPLPEAASEVVNGGDRDEVGGRLAAIESRLGRGEIEFAVQDLLALQRAYPADQRVKLRMARVLHQRALMRYGRGDVAEAIADWNRVIELDPAFEAARRLVPLAEAELRQRRAREKMKAGG